MKNCERSGIRERFVSPDTWARSFPFWAWNEKLEPEELKRQIREMYSQGMGGFFMHSREGLETEYMGKEWKECILTCVKEAHRLGMYAWLYDEDRWPSGTAGGLVTSGGDAYRCKGLTLEVCEKYDGTLWQDEQMMAVYAARVSQDDIFALRRMDEDDVLNAGEVCLAVRLEISGKSEWFNQEAPPDNLNPECVKRFLALTHDKYDALCGEEFGKTVPGIFTDEPSLADTHTKFPPHRSWIPWTYGLEEYFREQRGYDPLEYIPYIFFNGEHSRKIRHDYWHTIAVRFSESYAKTISEWCEEHGILMTGHFLQEDKLGIAIRVSGGIMPLYEYEHIPGIDILQEKTDEFMTVKQCASVAHQLGRKRVLSETYGCTGWDFTFEGQRRIGDWQYVLGVSCRCQHLALYSIAGCRKRDYPPCFNYNTTWWSHNRVVEDYFARLSVMLEEGKSVQQLLLLHPLSTAWSRLGCSPYGNPVRRNERDLPSVNAYGAEYNALIETLCFHHFDMDLGDEIILSKYAKAENAKIIVGEASYSTWVLPPIDTLLKSTFALLKEYVATGGKLIAMEPTATMLEGEYNEEVVAFWENKNCSVVKDAPTLLQKLENVQVRNVRVKSHDGAEDVSCLMQQRETEGEITLFVVNMDGDRQHKVQICTNQIGRVEEWCALNGEIYPVESHLEEEQLVFDVVLEASDSKLFRILKDAKVNEDCPKREKVYADIQSLYGTEKGYTFPETTDIRLSMTNTLILDNCQYRLEGENWSDDMQIWQAQKEVRERLGMRLIHSSGLEQRYKWIKQAHPSDGKPLELKMKFQVEEMPESEMELALEHPEWYEIFSNGHVVEQRVSGYLLDRKIQKVKLPHIKQGENELILRTCYRNAMEIENCYLCGDFGVNPARRIVRYPRTLTIGDWTKQGLLHYAGAIRYIYPFTYSMSGNISAYLKLSDYDASCVSVSINGNVVEVPWKSASLLNLSKYLHDGENELIVEVVGTPRNLFGPFHLKEGKPSVTNAACFHVAGEKYTEEYNVVPYGLYCAPELYLK